MSNEQTILAIAMNLTRMGNWAADGYSAKRKRIETFLEQTKGLVSSIEADTSRLSSHRTLRLFLRNFHALAEEAKQVPDDEQWWAERMMTWGNILTHRAKLLRVRQ
jgi:hypothetical protein